MAKTLISKAELMQQLGLSLMTVNRMMKSKKLPYVKLGKLVRFDQDKIEDLIERRTINKKVA